MYVGRLSDVAVWPNTHVRSNSSNFAASKVGVRQPTRRQRKECPAANSVGYRFVLKGREYHYDYFSSYLQIPMYEI